MTNIAVPADIRLVEKESGKAPRIKERHWKIVETLNVGSPACIDKSYKKCHKTIRQVNAKAEDFK